MFKFKLRLNNLSGAFALGKQFTIPNKQHLRIYGEPSKTNAVGCNSNCVIQAIKAQANVIVLDSYVDHFLYSNMFTEAQHQQRQDIYSFLSRLEAIKDNPNFKTNSIIYCSLNVMERSRSDFSNDFLNFVKIIKNGETIQNGKPTIVFLNEVQQNLSKDPEFVNAFNDLLTSENLPYTFVNFISKPCEETEELLQKYNTTVFFTKRDRHQILHNKIAITDLIKQNK